MSRPARCLVYIVFVLVALGIVVLASASGVKGQSSVGDPSYFVKRQLIWLTLALGAGIFCSRVHYLWWQRVSVPLLFLAILLLAIVLIPGIGAEINGSRRWMRLGFASFQPSEFAKLAVIVMMSAWMVHVGRHAHRFVEGFLAPAAVTGVICGLVFLEPDYGTTVLIAAVAFLIMFMGGTRVEYLGLASLAGAGLLSLAVMMDEVRSRRILAFLDPEGNPDAAFQLIQSKNAFILGAATGVGPGHSSQKHFFLPEAHTDFILAIIGEEMGMATVVVVALYGGIMICGLLIAMRAPDLFGRYLAMGVTTLVVLQAAINVGVVSGSLPTKGLALPFISYGGTSLLMSLAYVGILINIGRHALPPGAEPAHHTGRERRRPF